jgi:hypothetical protein
MVAGETPSCAAASPAVRRALRAFIGSLLRHCDQFERFILGKIAHFIYSFPV